MCDRNSDVLAVENAHLRVERLVAEGQIRELHGRRARAESLFRGVLDVAIELQLIPHADHEGAR